MKKCLLILLAVTLMLAGCSKEQKCDAPTENTAVSISGSKETASESSDKNSFSSSAGNNKTSNNERTSAKKTESPGTGSEQTKAVKSSKSVESEKTTADTTLQTQVSVQTHDQEKISETNTTKQTAESSASAYDVNYYIQFGKNYAASIGLTLDSSAADCWDNPISAGASCTYTERDIKDRLNRYKNIEKFTAVWLWAEDLGGGRYNIYIGYA